MVEGSPPVPMYLYLGTGIVSAVGFWLSFFAVLTFVHTHPRTSAVAFLTGTTVAVSLVAVANCYIIIRDVKATFSRYHVGDGCSKRETSDG